jgi:hypothetical protein
MTKHPKLTKSGGKEDMKPGWIRGWKDIGYYMGYSEKTVKRFYKKNSLPIERSPDGTPMAKPEKIDIWVTKKEYKNPEILKRVQDDTV